MIRSKIAMGFLWAILALLLHVGPLAPDVRAQGSRKDDIVFNSRGTPLAGATVRVCAMPASGQPCTPLALIFSDAALTQALANPTTSDGLGNYRFYAAPGRYMIEISGPGITTKQIPDVLLPSDPSSPTFTGAVNAFSLNLSGNLTVNGNTTVVGSLASGTLNLANQSTPPGSASSGTVNLYTKTLDKRLYYKDETGTEIGPIAAGSGAQTNITNTFTAPQNIDADFHAKGPNPSFDLARYGGYLGANIPPSTTASTTGGTPNVTLAAAQDFANGQGISIYTAGPAPGFPAWGSTNITAFSRTNNVASFTIAGEPTIGGYPNTAGQPITISGLADSSFNVSCNALATGPTSFTCANTGANVSNTAGSGTVTIITPVVVTPSGILNGSTTWNYKVVLRDYKGGLSVASPAGTTTTGVATLGINSVSICGITRTAGLTTVTTCAPHNFQSGVIVQISGTGGPGDASFEAQFTINATPTATTFTYLQTGAPDASGTVSSGTAKVVAKNTVQWNMQPYAVLQSIIYRSQGAGAYSIVGITEGMDSSFVDWGLTFNPAVLPNYIPSTPPATVTNQIFTTTIVSGGGTTNLVLASNATSTVAGATLLHDNAPNILNACGAMNGQGGTVYIPASNPQGSSAVINSPLNLTGCPLQTHFLLGSAVRVNDPIIPRNTQSFEGLPAASQGQFPPFVTDYVTLILGNGYPFFYVLPGTSGSNTFTNIYMQCLQVYQSCVAHDQDNSANGTTNFVYHNTYFNGGTGSYPYVFKGGFNFFFDRGGFITNSSQWGIPETVSVVSNQGLGISAQQSAYIIFMDKTYFVGGGLVYDFFGQNPLFGQVSNFTANQVLTESSRQPFLRYSTGNNPVAITTLHNPIYADFTGGPAMPMVDLTNSPVVSSFRVFNPQCANGQQPIFEASNQGGVEVTNGSLGCNIVGLNTFIFSGLQGGNTSQLFANVPVSASGPNGQFAFNMAQPAAPSAVASAGGSVTTGPITYYVTAVDVNGKESALSPGVNLNIVAGTQTVTVTPPVLPVGAVGYFPYKTIGGGGPFKVAISGCGPLAGGVPYVDTVSFSCGTNPSAPAAAATSLSTAGLSAATLNMTGGGNRDAIAGTFTAARFQTLPDNTGYIPVTSYLNTAYDNATRANGSIGTGWTVQQNGLNIAGNQIQGTTGSASNTAFWNASPFSTSQFAQATITALNGVSDFPGVTVLASGTGATSTYYDCVENSTNIFLQRIVNAVTTTLTSAASAGAAGDVLRLEVAPGGALTCLKNGAVALTTTDTQIFSGSPGLLISGNVATVKNWNGGNLHPLAQLDIEQDWTKVQHFTQGLAFGTEAVSASPRAEQNVFLPGTLTTTWTGATWTTDKAISVTRIQLQAKTAPAGCATNAVVRFTDGTSPVNLTVAGAANDSGPITQNYAAGASLQVLVQTAAAGCTTSPADANVVVQYRMQ